MPSFRAALLTTALIALINALLWPLVIRVVLPLTVLSFGLGSLVLSAAVVSIAIKVVDGTSPPFLGAIAAAFVVSIALMLLAPALSFDDDARQLRIVRRRARRVRDANRTEVPGVILFEIDGLAEPVLRRALREGHAPNMARWLEQGTHRIVPWECDLSSQTGASQAGLLLGSNHDMPAFRWYEKESGRTMVSNHGKDATELERRRSDGGGLLAVDGASRGNLFSGDAPRCSATMSVIRDRRRSSAGEYFAYFADPYGLTRTIALYFWDVLLELRAARRQRRRGEEHVDRGGLYPLMRGAITVIMRDLNVAILLGDIVEGVPVVYSTFVGYDEVAHHSGIEQPDAFAVLRQHDAQLARLERAVEQAPRPYHLVVLSDHGQSQGRPFRQRYELELGDLVQGALRDGDVFSPAASDEGLSTVGGALTDARDEDNAGARMLARATSGNLVDGEVVLGPNRKAVEEEKSDASEHEAVVLASGGLGLIYLTERSQRMTIGEIDRLHPRLISDLDRSPRNRLRHGARRRAMARSSSARAGLGAFGMTRSAARIRCGTSGRTPPIISGARTGFPLPGPAGQLHVRPGRKRGRAVRGVHGLARWHRRLAEPPVRPGAGLVERGERSDRRRGGDARGAPRVAFRYRARAQGSRHRGSSRAAWHGAHTEPGLSQRDLEGHRRSAARFEASIA